MTIFFDRADAGRALARALKPYARDNAVVIALPRGGVPVAFEIARELHLPLDVLIVRKLPTPGQAELAMGAIASGGLVTLNDRVIGQIEDAEERVQEAIVTQRAELERREQIYRSKRKAIKVKGRDVIVVDDGAATGATMRVAILALKHLGARTITVALPAAAVDTYSALTEDADRVVCLETPVFFDAVGSFYRVFDQTSDAEVMRLLSEADVAAEPAPTQMERQ